MPLMISRIGQARGRPVLFAAGKWGSITRHSLSVTSVWYRFVSRICCIRVVGVHMVSPGLVSANPWNHADPSHSTSFETASEPGTMKNSNLLVFTTCYNERGNIGALIDKIVEQLPSADVLVVDDTSP